MERDLQYRLPMRMSRKEREDDDDDADLELFQNISEGSSLFGCNLELGLGRSGSYLESDQISNSPIYRVARGRRFDDLLSGEGPKNDYDWLLTPPSSPQYSLSQRKPQSTNFQPSGLRKGSAIPGAVPTIKSSKLMHTLSDPTGRSRRNGLSARQALSGLNGSINSISTRSLSMNSSTGSSTISSSSRSVTPSRSTVAAAARSSTPTRSSAPSRSSRPSTPTRQTISAPSPRPATPTKTTSSPIASSSTRPSRPSTPTRSAPAPPVRSSTPGRPARPTTLTTATTTTTPSRPVTPPSGRSPLLQLSPKPTTTREVVPRTTTSSRPSTPTRRPSTPTRAHNSYTPPIPSSPSRSRDSLIPSRIPSTSRPSSPSPRPQHPPTPLILPGFSDDTPPNLRTTIHDRPPSVTRGRPRTPSSASQNLSDASNNRPRRQSCSPSATRGRKSGDSIFTDRSIRLNRSYISDSGLSNSSFSNARPARPQQEDLALPRSNSSNSYLRRSAPAKYTMESSGYGMNFSKKSLDMAIRHMDIGQNSPSGIRPRMATQASPVHHSFRSTPTNGRPHNSFIPSVTSSSNSNGSSEQTSALVHDDECTNWLHCESQDDDNFLLDMDNRGHSNGYLPEKKREQSTNRGNCRENLSEMTSRDHIREL